jgi:hypothetical protein
VQLEMSAMGQKRTRHCGKWHPYSTTLSARSGTIPGCFGPLDIDGELKLRRVLHRQVGRLSAAHRDVPQVR